VAGREPQGSGYADEGHLRGLISPLWRASLRYPARSRAGRMCSIYRLFWKGDAVVACPCRIMKIHKGIGHPLYINVALAA
jgi:hypothetical protein